MNRNRSLRKSSIWILPAFVVWCSFAHAGPICTGNCYTEPNVQVGSFGGGDGTLSVSSGDVLTTTSSAFIGAFGTDTGTATVSGSGARLDTGGESGSILFVGTDGGTGDLTVSDGGTVTSNGYENPNAFADARVFIGVGGTGTVNVTSGGTLISQDLGGTGGEDGIQIGNSRNGTDGSIAGPGNGVLNVSGDGSYVLATGNSAFINVATTNTFFTGPYAGNGVLNVSDGGVVEIDGNDGFGILSIGRGADANGVVSVSGTGSSINVHGTSLAAVTVADDFTQAIGSGTGSLTIADGGSVNVWTSEPGINSFAIVGYGLGTGSLTINDGGALNVANGEVYVSQNDAETGNSAQSGTLTVNGTGVVNALTTYVGNGTSPTVNGVLAGTGTINGDVVVREGGSLQPGNSPGTLTINGDLGFSGGLLEIEIGGLSAGAFDVLKVSGTANLASANVVFHFIDNFLPTTGDLVEFLIADAIAGLTSAKFSYLGVPDGFAFDVFEAGGVLRLLTVKGVPVPEPGPLGLMMIGLIALAGLRFGPRLLSAVRHTRADGTAYSSIGFDPSERRHSI